jgi:hypothetical protein
MERNRADFVDLGFYHRITFLKKVELDSNKI